MKHLALAAIVLSALLSRAMPAAGAEMTGKEVFDHYCSYCHASADGPGTMQLRRTRGADKALLTERSDLTPEYIMFIVRHGLKSMPAFVPSDLTDAKLKAVAAFLAKS